MKPWILGIVFSTSLLFPLHSAFAEPAGFKEYRLNGKSIFLKEEGGYLVDKDGAKYELLNKGPNLGPNNGTPPGYNKTMPPPGNPYPPPSTDSTRMDLPGTPKQNPNVPSTMPIEKEIVIFENIVQVGNYLYKKTPSGNKPIYLDAEGNAYLESPGDMKGTREEKIVRGYYRQNESRIASYNTEDWKRANKLGKSAEPSIIDGKEVPPASPTKSDKPDKKEDDKKDDKDSKKPDEKEAKKDDKATGEKCALVVGEPATAAVATASAYGLAKRNYRVTFIAGWAEDSATTKQYSQFISENPESPKPTVITKERKKAVEKFLEDAKSGCSQIEIVFANQGKSCTKGEDHELFLSQPGAKESELIKTASLVKAIRDLDRAKKTVNLVMPGCETQMKELASLEYGCAVVYPKGDAQQMGCQATDKKDATRFTAVDAVLSRYWENVSASTATSPGVAGVKHRLEAFNAPPAARDCLNSILAAKATAIANCKRIYSSSTDLQEQCNFNSISDAFWTAYAGDDGLTEPWLSSTAAASNSGSAYQVGLRTEEKGETQNFASALHEASDTPAAGRNVATPKSIRIDWKKLEAGLDLSDKKISEPYAAVETAIGAYNDGVSKVPPETPAKIRELAQKAAIAYRKLISAARLKKPEVVESANNACKKNKL